MNNYFDKIYLLNLKRKSERLTLSQKRMLFADISVEVFDAVDGSVMKKILPCSSMQIFLKTIAPSISTI